LIRTVNRDNGLISLHAQTTPDIDDRQWAHSSRAGRFRFGAKAMNQRKTHASTGRLWTAAVIGVLLTCVTVTAHAGGRWSYRVMITLASGQPGDTISRADGSIMAAARSANSPEFIYCMAYVSTAPTGPRQDIRCYAKDSTNRMLVCTSSDARFIPLVSGINELSHITFTVEGGRCLGINVVNGSPYVP
jgi:hypothetical protein